MSAFRACYIRSIKFNGWSYARRIPWLFSSLKWRQWKSLHRYVITHCHADFHWLFQSLTKVGITKDTVKECDLWCIYSLTYFIGCLLAIYLACYLQSITFYLCINKNAAISRRWLTYDLWQCVNNICKKPRHQSTQGNTEDTGVRCLIF